MTERHQMTAKGGLSSLLTYIRKDLPCEQILILFLPLLTLLLKKYSGKHCNGKLSYQFDKREKACSTSTLLILLWLLPSARSIPTTGSLGWLLLQLMRNRDEEDIHLSENQFHLRVYLVDLFEPQALQLTPQWPKPVWK